MEFPIVEMLVRYKNSRPLRLHMPGHKGGIIVERADFCLKSDKPKEKEVRGEEDIRMNGAHATVCRDVVNSHTAPTDFTDMINAAAAFDITELSFSDNLLNPQGVIKRSEELFAAESGVKYSHYSINGSSAGIFALLNICDRVLIERAAHMSVFNAVRTLKKTTYVINNSVEDGVPLPIALEEIKYAIERKRVFGTEIGVGTDAVLICGANYYGMRASVESIYEYLKERGIKLFIDGAHGAHYGRNRMPPSFASCCDAYVVSIHKTLSSLTQTAVLNVNDEQINLPLKKSLSVFTSTSPSYLLLAAIDYSRFASCFADGIYEALYEAYLKFLNAARDMGIHVLKNDDFTRLIISTDGLNGEGLYRAMEERGIFCEFYDEKRVCMIITLNDKPEIYETILNTLFSVNEVYKATKNQSEPCIIKETASNKGTVGMLEQQKTIIKAVYQETMSGTEQNTMSKKAIQENNKGKDNSGGFIFRDKHVKRCIKLIMRCSQEYLSPLNMCEGKISASDVCIFPPSFPLLLKGERITKKHIAILSEMKPERVVGLYAGFLKVCDR